LDRTSKMQSSQVQQLGLKIATTSAELQQAEENGDNVRIVRLKTKIAELKLEYKIEEAELELKQAEQMGARDPVRLVRLKTKIAELKLEQEEKRPTIYTETVNRLKDELENLKQELDRLIAKENVGASEHDKGA